MIYAGYSRNTRRNALTYKNTYQIYQSDARHNKVIMIRFRYTCGSRRCFPFNSWSNAFYIGEQNVRNTNDEFTFILT